MNFQEPRDPNVMWIPGRDHGSDDECANCRFFKAEGVSACDKCLEGALDDEDDEEEIRPGGPKNV